MSPVIDDLLVAENPPQHRESTNRVIKEITIDVKTIQSVMRHADIKLTLDRYGHLFPGSEADAVARLRGAFCTSEQLQATGTDESGPRGYSANYSTQGAFECESGLDDAVEHTTTERRATMGTRGF